MKNLITLSFLLVISSICFGQKITRDNFNDNFNTLLENLNQEKWTEANKICAALLNYSEPIDSMQIEKKVLRYIQIYTIGGLMSERKLTKEEALTKAKYLKNKEMIMPAHPFNSECYVNCTHFAEEKDTFFSAVNNRAGTEIFAFEYVKIKGGIKATEEELTGKNIILKGKLIEISTEGNMFPRFKLEFTDGEYEIKKD